MNHQTHGKLLPLLLILALLLTGCAGTASETKDAEGTLISSDKGEVTVSGGGARWKDGVVEINSAGTYTLRGAFDNAQVLVDTGEEPMKVKLILDGVSVVNPEGPALHVRQAKSFHLELAEGTENLLRSGEENWQSAAAEAEGAALYAEDDLDIGGEGLLRVEGYINNGISCKNDIDLNSGTIELRAVNNGIRARNSLQLKGAAVRVVCLGDGLKTSKADKEGKGNVEIRDGSVSVEAMGDGIQAAAQIRIGGGSVSVFALGDGGEQSSKALKAEGEIIVSGGDVELSSSEDAVRSELGLRLEDGTLRISTEGDAIEVGPKEGKLGFVEISGGSLRIARCRQAVKARERFAISGGSLLALCSSEKQSMPDECAFGCILCACDGREGDELRVGGLEALRAAADFQMLFCADGSLQAGQSVPVGGLARPMDITAR